MSRNENLTNRRHRKRYAAYINGWIRLECGRTMPCSIVDISVDSERVEISTPIYIRKCCFEKADISIYRSQYINITIVRQNGNILGTRFNLDRAGELYIERLVSAIAAKGSLDYI